MQPSIPVAPGLDSLEGDLARWLESIGRDLPRAFEECRRPEWLVRIALALAVDRRVLVSVAAEVATLALRRNEQQDLRASRCVATALRFARGESDAAEAWAMAFAATQAASELAEDQPLASEAALAAAAAGFSCDPRADDHYYAQRAHAVEAIEHAVRAYGAEHAVGSQRCLAIARARITLEVLSAAASRAAASRAAARRPSVRPPRRR